MKNGNLTRERTFSFLQIRLNTILWMTAVVCAFIAGRVSSAPQIKKLTLQNTDLQQRATAAEGFLAKMRQDFERALGGGNPSEIYYFDVDKMPREVP